MELHHCPQSVKLILSRRLDTNRLQKVCSECESISPTGSKNAVTHVKHAQPATAGKEHATRRLLGSVVRQITVLPLPTGIRKLVGESKKR
jgi:hypothetical protein